MHLWECRTSAPDAGGFGPGADAIGGERVHQGARTALGHAAVQSGWAAYPLIGLDVTVENTREVAQVIVQGVADIGFVEGVIDEPSLSVAAPGET